MKHLNIYITTLFISYQSYNNIGYYNEVAIMLYLLAIYSYYITEYIVVTYIFITKSQVFRLISDRTNYVMFCFHIYLERNISHIKHL